MSHAPSLDGEASNSNEALKSLKGKKRGNQWVKRGKGVAVPGLKNGNFLSSGSVQSMGPAFDPKTAKGAAGCVLSAYHQKA